MASRSNERPIVIVRRKRAGAAAHHGGAWKVAYADFVTAMMAFFMLLWLISNPDKQRLKGLAEYFSPVQPSADTATTMTSSPGDTPGQGGRTRRAQGDSDRAVGQPSMESGTAGTSRGGSASVPDVSLRVMAAELRVALSSLPEAEGLRDNIRVEPSREGVRVSLTDTANRSMFVGPTAQLNGYARGLLAGVARQVAASGSMLAIEGHTDAAGGNDDANWRLSADRAQAARSALAAGGLGADRFREVVALAGTRPVYPLEPARPENRRITVVLLAEEGALPADVHGDF